MELLLYYGISVIIMTFIMFGVSYVYSVYQKREVSFFNHLIFSLTMSAVWPLSVTLVLLAWLYYLLFGKINDWLGH